MAMLHTSELDMAASVDTSDIDTFLTNLACAICSTYHTVLQTSPGTAILGWDMLFDIPSLADWKKIGDYRQRQTDLNTKHENKYAWSGIIKSVIKNCYRKMVSANQKAVMNVILGLSHLFTQMAQLGFNVEQNQND